MESFNKFIKTKTESIKAKTESIRRKIDSNLDETNEEQQESVTPTTSPAAQDIQFVPPNDLSTSPTNPSSDDAGGGANTVSDDDTTTNTPTTKVPRRGSYMMDKTPDEKNNNNNSHEINFSPSGGSSMVTGEVPKKGSYVGDSSSSFSSSLERNNSTDESNNNKTNIDDEQQMKSSSLSSSPEHHQKNHPQEQQQQQQQPTIKEINFSPSAGHDMETSGAPNQGSYTLKRRLISKPVVPVDEEYVQELTLQDDDQERWRSKKAHLKEQQDFERDACKPTPKTSNKSVVKIVTSVDGTLGVVASSSNAGVGGDNTTTSLLPKKNPLDDDSSTSTGGSSTPFSTSHSGDDISPVAPIRHPSDGSFQSLRGGITKKKDIIMKDGGITMSSKVMSLEREKELANDDDDMENDGSVSSSFVGDVDERGVGQDDIQYQPEGYLKVEPMHVPQEGGFTDKLSSIHTEDTSAMTASGVTTEREINFSPGGSDIKAAPVPRAGSFRGNIDDLSAVPENSEETEKKNEEEIDAAFEDMEAILDEALDDEIFQNKEEPALSESYIPGESFLKMGAMLQSQHDASGVAESAPVEAGGDVTDELLDSVLDDDLIVGGDDDEEGKNQVKDEHDDLLDSMLGDDDDFDDGNVNVPADQEDELLDSVLGDDDHGTIEKEEIQKNEEEPPVEADDDYVPDDEDILKLEALLDEGLDDHEPMAEDKEDDHMNDNEVDPHDSMAHELDNLLNDDLEEEIKFDDEPMQPDELESTEIPKSATTITKTKEKKKPSIPTTTKEKKKPSIPKFTSQKKSKPSVKTKTGPTPVKDVSKKKTAVGRVSNFLKSRGTPKAANEKTKQPTPGSVKKSMFRPKTSVKKPKEKKIDISMGQGKVVSNPENTKFASPAPRSMMKRFMSPTFTSLRHTVSPTENTHSRARYSSPMTPSPTSVSTGKRSFMSSTFSSLRKFKKDVEVETIEEIMLKRTPTSQTDSEGKKIRGDEAFMEPTLSKTIKETETQIIETQKAIEKESEAKKIIVNLKPWGRNQKPHPVLDFSHSFGSGTQHPAPRLRSPNNNNETEFIGEVTPKGRLEWTPRGLVSSDEKPYRRVVGMTPLKHSPHTILSPQSHASLSTQCTIHSFVSPDKAGVLGCQSKFNPYLHKYKGPCELCVFRLSDKEKAELDAHGRHFMVQFTLGGCPDCHVFPTSFDEAPVRLCPKCFAMSHRYKKRTPRKKGNDSARIGYSFAKVEYS